MCCHYFGMVTNLVFKLMVSGSPVMPVRKGTIPLLRVRSLGVTNDFNFVSWKNQIRSLPVNAAESLAPVSSLPISGGRKVAVQILVRESVSNQSHLGESRHATANSKSTFSKFKETRQIPAITNGMIQSWAKSQSASVASGAIQEELVKWNRKLAQCVRAGQYEKTMQFFREMQGLGFTPNSYTFVQVLRACSRLGALDKGRDVHAQVKKNCCESDKNVANSLIDMYAKCGSMEDAWRVFNLLRMQPVGNVVAWSSLIVGYVKFGDARKALALFHHMQQEGVKPDHITFVGVLNACASLRALGEGKRIHDKIVQCELESNIYVGNSLVDMYAKCGEVEGAMSVFIKMPKRNVVTWSAMILAYVKCGDGQRALALYRQMQAEGVEPNPFTFVAVLNACSSLVAFEEGKSVHKDIICRGYQDDVYVASSLVDMYAKCGSIEHAQLFFNKMGKRNSVSWNTMLGGYAMHGLAREAIEHFEKMNHEGVEISGVAFVSLLSACSHGGLVDEGLSFFQSMLAVYNICPTAEHHACLIDLLGRAGRLHEARDLLLEVASQVNVDAWRSLLGACRIYGNVEMGETVASEVLRLDPGSSSGYVLLSNIYAAAGRWESSETLQKERLVKGAEKDPGRTWIEVNNDMHSFVVNDAEHPQISQISHELDRLHQQITAVGYIPDTRFVLRDLDEESKQVSLRHHSEKLAITFGLISTPPGTPLLIYKNLRVCGDCHNAIKFISKVTERKITVRDGNRFHRFEGGFCSCRDYW